MGNLYTYTRVRRHARTAKYRHRLFNLNQISEVVLYTYIVFTERMYSQSSIVRNFLYFIY